VSKHRFTQKNIATWSIYHPVGVVMLALAVIVVGLFSLSKLGIDLLPHIIYPEIAIRVNDSGVPATIMEEQITRELEASLALTEDAISIQSRSSEGSCAIDLSFPYGKDIDIALRDASARLDRAKRFLPNTIDAPTIFKRDPAQSPVLELAIHSALFNSVELRTWVDDQLSKWFINLPGVAAVDVGGGLVREIQVLPNMYQLAALGISLEDLSKTLQQANVEVTGGRVQMTHQELNTRLMGRWQEVADIAAVTLNKAQSTIPLRDIAQVIDTHQDERLRVRFNDIPSIKLSMQKQPQANTVAVAQAIQDRMHWLNQQKILPKDTQLDVIDDQSIYVKQALNNATSSAVSGTILAMLVIWLFLANLRHTLIIGTAIPLAITLTLILMAYNDLTLNIMSLGGLALCVGIVVDNTIVMLENINRIQTLQPNATPEINKKNAAYAVNEITSALVASTTTNLASIIPFLFVSGLIGLLFRELIFTLSVATAASLLVSITVVPALAGLSPPSTHTGFLFPLEQLLRHGYRWSMRRALRVPWLIVLLFCIGLGVSLQQFMHNKQTFLPGTDEGKVRVYMVADPGIALEEMDEATQRLEKMLRQQPEVVSIFTQMGGMISGRSQFEASNQSTLNVQLLPSSQRKLDVNQWIAQMNKSLKQLNLVGVKISMASVGIRGIRLGSSDDSFSLRLRGDDLGIMADLAEKLVQKLKDIKELNNLKHSAEENFQELAVIVDRRKASDLGFNLESMGQDINTLLNGKIATYFYTENDKINVRLRLPPEQVRSPRDVENLLLYSPTKQAVRLGELAKLQWLPVPREIQRDQQQRIVEITANINENSSLPEIFAEVQRRIANFPLPVGYNIYESGAMEVLKQNQSLNQWLLGLAIFLVFVVMAVQYESLLNPLVILLSIPFALIGVQWGLNMTQLPLSMPVWLGIITLAGMVVNNSIILVETIELQRNQGMSARESVIEAGALRLRPILMTTLTTIVGSLPLALGWGEGTQMLQPLAVTVVYGLIFSLLVSLLLIPLCYAVVRG
jgi:multidrug efflux pump subunit AcrB